MATRTRRQFTDAFKTEAIRLTRESGRPVSSPSSETVYKENFLAQ